MAVFSSCCRSLRCSGPKPEVGRVGQKHRGHQVVRNKEESSGFGPLTRGCWGVEIGCKALDVAADRDTLISDPKGTKHRHGAVGWQGCPRQGPHWAWGCHSERQGLPTQIPQRLASPASLVWGTQPHGAVDWGTSAPIGLLHCSLGLISTLLFPSCPPIVHFPPHS